MGFSYVKRALVTALEAGNFQHEAREVFSEKNLLAVGDISVEEVIGIVKRTRARTIRFHRITGIRPWRCMCFGRRSRRLDGM